MNSIREVEPAPKALAGRVACTRKEYASATGVCVATVTNWIRDGHIQSYKVGGRRLIPVTELTRTGQAA